MFFENSSDFFPKRHLPISLTSIEILQQNVISEQKIVLCHSVLRCWGVVNSLIFSLDIETLVNIQEERKIQSG